jgi:hypothetical protein
MRTWLSVDWDFFVRSLGQWDWSHKEAPFFMGSAMWQIRLAPFFMQGINLVDEMDPKKWAKPRPDNFWYVLSQLGYNLEDTEYFVVSDSHAAAGPVFNEVASRKGAADVIINFDAHHDLGYCEWASIERMIEAGECTCDMWLGALMSWWPTLKARIVYPNWLQEENTLQNQWDHMEDHLPEDVLNRVEIGWFEERDGTISQIVRDPGEELDVEAVFVCRSSAWTPPWLDEEFLDFLESAEQYLDREPFDHDSAYDRPTNAMEPRSDFSFDDAERLGDQWRMMMDKTKKPTT